MPPADKLRATRSRSVLGAPPPPTERHEGVTEQQPARPQRAIVTEARIRPEQPVYHRVDGRSLRSTGRTVPLATKVSPEFDTALRQTAEEQGLMMVQVLELALDAWRKLAARAAETEMTPQAVLDDLLRRPSRPRKGQKEAINC